MICAEYNLARILHRLLRRKILLTNVPRGYAHAVVRHLRLHHHFARHVPIEMMRVQWCLYSPSSRSRRCSKLLEARRAARAHDCILVENKVENLVCKRAGFGHCLGHAIPENGFDVAGSGGRVQKGQIHKMSCLCRCQSAIGASIQIVAPIAVFLLNLFK